MDLKTLADLPPWDWPAGAGAILLEALRSTGTAESDRLLAVDLASDSTAMDDELVDALLSILRNGNESETLRGQAAIALGPVLEEADTQGFEDPEGTSISEPTFDAIQESLHRLYLDAGVPQEVRRRVLEAAVRAPEPWHEDAVRVAWGSGDPAWKLTAVFCMRFVRGFDAEILAALDDPDPHVHRQAVCAAGAFAVDAAWPHVASLVGAAKIDKPLLLAAIDAVASIRPREAEIVLGDLLESDDEDITDAVSEALVMAEELGREDVEDEADEDENA